MGRIRLGRAAWQLSLDVQALAIPALLGLTAVQEFVTRGLGTPVPFDPPRRLVTTGIYAYVANPMQLSAVLLLVMLGVVLRNPWVSAAGVMAHIYSAGLAGWDEEVDLRRRFGADWTAYRLRVRRWLPTWRPSYTNDAPVATLFVAEECGMCREVSEWFRRRGVRGLTVVPAESHPSGALTRITYEPADGTRAARGTEAVARALEHVHLGWATIGFTLRMPVVSSDRAAAGRRVGRRAPPNPRRRLAGVYTQGSFAFLSPEAITAQQPSPKQSLEGL